MIKAHSPKHSVIFLLNDLIKQGTRIQMKLAADANSKYVVVKDQIEQKLHENVNSPEHKDALKRSVKFHSDYWDWERTNNWFTKLFSPTPYNDVNDKEAEAVQKVVEEQLETITTFLDGTGIEVLEACEKHTTFSIYSGMYHSSQRRAIEFKIVEVIQEFMEPQLKRFDTHQHLKTLISRVRDMFNVIQPYQYDSITLSENDLITIKTLQDTIKKYS